MSPLHSHFPTSKFTSRFILSPNNCPVVGSKYHHIFRGIAPRCNLLPTSSRSIYHLRFPSNDSKRFYSSQNHNHQDQHHQEHTGNSYTSNNQGASKFSLHWYHYLLILPPLLIIYAIFSISYPLLLQNYTLKLDLDNDDVAFQWLMYWLSQVQYSRDCTHLTVFTLRSGSAMYNWLLNFQHAAEAEEDTEADENANNFVSRDEILIPAPGAHIFKYRGMWIYLYYDKEPASSSNSTPGAAGKSRENITMWILNPKRQNLVNILKDAQSLYEKQRQNKTSIYMPDTHMISWEEVERKDPRNLNSIVLREGQMESLIGDLETFRGRKQFYRQKGIPFRRGYLLYGIPGSGKTSTVLALAGEYGYNICLLNIGASAMNDETLNHLLMKAPKNSIILLEDIDACVASVSNHSEPPDEDEQNFPSFFNSYTSDSKVTLSGLLNILDGVHSKEGRVIFCTSNHPENLQPALIRPGRIDFRLEIGYATEAQIRRLFEYFYAPVGREAAILHETGTPESISLDQLSNQFLEALRAQQENSSSVEIAPSTLSSYFLMCPRPEDAIERVSELRRFTEL